jgi:hypothetical protein
MTKPPNFSTTVAAEKTAAECVLMLGHYGATQVTLFFGEHALPTGMTFVIDTPGGQRGYKLTADFDRACRALLNNREVPRKNSGRAQAERTAWKTLRDWLASQLLMIETGLLDPEQALLAYSVNEQGRTLWDVTAERRALGGKAVATVVE